MSLTQLPTRLLPRWPFVHEKLRNGSVTKYTHRQHVSGCALNWMSMLRIVFPTLCTNGSGNVLENMLILSDPSLLLWLLHYVLNVIRNTQLGGYGIGYLNALML